MAAVVVLLRHGESEANAAGQFAGRLDVPLTGLGETQARRAGEILVRNGIMPDLVLTSPLRRAADTALAVVASTGCIRPPVRVEALIERGYGAVEGRRRADVLLEQGAERFHSWHRGWTERPPAGANGNMTESLTDVAQRVLPFWNGCVEPVLRLRCAVVLVGHSNSLRVLVRHLGGLTEAEAGRWEIPPGVPVVVATTPGGAGRLRTIVT